MTRELIDAMGVVRIVGPVFSCARTHHGLGAASAWVRVDVARGGRHCLRCGSEWCRHGRRPL
jgi:hypothetical protein